MLARCADRLACVGSVKLAELDAVLGTLPETVTACLDRLYLVDRSTWGMLDSLITE
jgi:hypothetical protein